jgi:Isochorismatase family
MLARRRIKPLEIEIEATARDAADRGFLPVVVEDACGVVEVEAAERSLASLDYSLMSYRANAAQVVDALSGGKGKSHRRSPLAAASTVWPAGP